MERIWRFAAGRASEIFWRCQNCSEGALFAQPRAVPLLLHTSQDARNLRPFTGVPAEGGSGPAFTPGFGSCA